MNKKEQSYFDEQYLRHLRALKLQGKSDATISSYGRAVRRLAKYFDCSPDKLSIEQLTAYFAELVETHSWSMVKVDRNGLQFFWKHVLNQPWQWLDIIKPPKVYSLPDILTINEIERLIAVTYKLRYKVFILATYSMGLRLAETLHLQVGDIDAARKLVHIRRGKGHKDRFVPLPDVTCLALRHLWRKHRNPVWLFPSGTGSMETISQATSPMDRGGAQAAMKAALADCGIKKKPLFTLCAIV
jgi:site-specific recombinase XerD